MNKNDRILITGGTGFIGSYILKDLLHHGYDNLVATKRPSSDMTLVEEVADRVKWVELDILDIVGLSDIVSDVRAIIHAAAMVSFASNDRDALMKINVEGTANLINLALEEDVKRFIHISSIATIASSSSRPLVNENDERDVNAENSSYAISKQKAEMEVFRGGGEGLSIGILNPSLVLGSGFWNKGSASMFRQIQKGLPFYPKGLTGFVDVRDVAKAATILLDNPISGERFIISGENRSYQSIFDAIAEGLDAKKPKIPLSPFLREAGYWVSKIISGFVKDKKLLSRSTLRSSAMTVRFDNEKSINELGLMYRPIEKTIQETCSQFKKSNLENSTAMSLPI